jgi:hypothetical protein
MFKRKLQALEMPLDDSFQPTREQIVLFFRSVHGLLWLRCLRSWSRTYDIVGGLEEKSFRKFVILLEDTKVRHYTIDDRKALRDVESADWPAALAKVGNIPTDSFLYDHIDDGPVKLIILFYSSNSTASCLFCNCSILLHERGV